MWGWGCRDYRFYESDMLHPSGVAVDHIYRAFVQSYVDSKAQGLINELEALRRALAHRPFHPEGEGHQSFLRGLRQKVLALQERYPYMRMEEEMQAIDAVLVDKEGSA